MTQRQLDPAPPHLTTKDLSSYACYSRVLSVRVGVAEYESVGAIAHPITSCYRGLLPSALGFAGSDELPLEQIWDRRGVLVGLRRDEREALPRRA
jgi:hypothetical protein